MTTTSNLANAEADAFLRRRRRKNALMIAVSVVCMVVAAYLFFQQATVDPYDYGPGPIAFADSLQSNAELTADEIASLPLTGAAGQPLDLKQYRGDKNVVLVFTRGWTGGPPAGAEKYYVGNVCLYCATQTARMAANYSQFQGRDAEVIVVFPVQRRDDSKHLAEFEEAVARQDGAGKIPFPLAVDLELKAVDRLGIRKDLSKPATYILDRDGKVRFAYVGSSLADRPSVKAMLDQLDAINKPLP